MPDREHRTNEDPPWEPLLLCPWKLGFCTTAGMFQVLLIVMVVRGEGYSFQEWGGII